MPPSRGLRSPLPRLAVRALVAAAMAFCAAVAGWLPATQGSSAGPAVATLPLVSASHLDETAGVATEPSSTPAPTSVGPPADTHWMGVAVLPAQPAAPLGMWGRGAPPVGAQQGADDRQAAACRGPPARVAPALSV
jgi:hypothetical protein